MNKKRIYFWVAATSPFNSILIQIRLIVKILNERLGINCIILNPDTPNVKDKLKKINSDFEIVFWHYGGYDKYLKYINKNNIYFVYHNITPAHFFMFSEPKVFFGSILGYLQLKLMKKSSKWITMSEFNRKELLSIGFKNVIISPNIITKEDVTHISKTEHPSLLFVGRISPNKNVLNLINQVSKFAQNNKEKIELIIIGEGKKKCIYREKFIKKVNIKYPNLVINWIKNISYEDLVKYYMKSWLYVSMSLHEGFGVPVLESIAYGTPALYLECGGQESVLNNVGLVNLSEKDNFHMRIKEIIENESEYALLLKRQVEIVNCFIKPNIDDKIVKVYTDIL